MAVPGISATSVKFEILALAWKRFIHFKLLIDKITISQREKEMLIKISERIQSWAIGWLILSFIVGFVLFINCPLGDPALISISLDGRIGYTPEQAFSAVSSYGNGGRLQMIWIHLGDFILIALYTSVFCLSISWLFKRGFKIDSKMQRLKLFPVVGGLFDVMENVWILTMILLYPAKPMVVGWLAIISTTGKYIMSFPIISVLMIGKLKAGMNGFKVQDSHYPSP